MLPEALYDVSMQVPKWVGISPRSEIGQLKGGDIACIRRPAKCLMEQVDEFDLRCSKVPAPICRPQLHFCKALYRFLLDRNPYKYKSRIA